MTASSQEEPAMKKEEYPHETINQALDILQAQDLKSDLYRASHPDQDDDYAEVGEVSIPVVGEDGELFFGYGLHPAGDVLLDCLDASGRVVVDITERSQLGRRVGRGVRKGLIRHYLPSGLKSDKRSIEVCLLLTDHLLSQ